MKEGKRVSPSVPYGYLHDPNDKHKLIVDEAAAKTVRRIFQMVIEGKSLGKIADILCEEKVLIPSAYWWEYHPDHAHTKVYHDKYRWSSTAVSYILNKREYMGHTILGKSKSLSYKTKKRVPVPLEEQYVFENTHQPIVSEEVWNTAHRLRKTVRRPTKTGEPPYRLTGILYCADCGSKMTKRGGIHNKFDSDNCYICSKYRQYNHNCSIHYIKVSVVEKLILDIITRVSDYVKNNEKEYLEKVQEVTNTYKENRLQNNKKQLTKGKKRIVELDNLVKKLYETFASGKLPENHFERLLSEYDTEQQELQKNIEVWVVEIEDFKADEMKAYKFLDVVKRYSDFTELTTPMLNEFIEKVVIHEADKSTGDRKQKIDIHLNFIGKFAPPNNDEILTAEQRKKDAEKEKIALKRRNIQRERNRIRMQAYRDKQKALQLG